MWLSQGLQSDVLDITSCSLMRIAFITFASTFQCALLVSILIVRLHCAKLAAMLSLLLCSLAAVIFLQG